ncbi:OGFOD1 family protein [Megaselia abdita]
MVNQVEWNRKQMDLFEFFQSTDISNLNHCPGIYQFYNFLKNEAKPLVEKLTNMKFTRLTATCSMYTRGDYLLVHDDLLSNRRIAFVYYISPWDNAKEWSDEMGGSLEIFGTDENDLPQFPVLRKINPKDNQFVFFKVGRKSFHQVGEVTCTDHPRITINGWFYGDEDHPENPLDKLTNDDLSLSIKKPSINSNLKIINENYLSKDSKIEIQSQIEDNSEIKLDKFFSEDFAKEVLKELKTLDTWKVKGPAISQYYEYLDLTNLENSSSLRKFIDIFKSEEFIKLLHEYTELDIYGPKSKSPKLTLELQKWSSGCYSILGDIGSNEDALDLIFYFNEAENVGNVTYINNEDEEIDDEESVLLTVEPSANSMNIVYRTSQQIRFVKYISKNKPLPDGPVFIMSASYKE